MTPSTPKYLPGLQEGATLKEVVILQDKLKKLGYYNDSITGKFGKDTVAAVKAFQKENKISPSGIVGAKTWDALYEQTIPAKTLVQNVLHKRILNYGDEGADVRELQLELSKLLYYTGAKNGKFDKATQNAVKAFQISNKLKPDGIVGKKTLEALTKLTKSIKDCRNDECVKKTFDYTVVTGDSLYALSKKFNTTVDLIKKTNKLPTNTIYIGQKLKIPVKNYFEYSVHKNDSIYSIAKQFSTNVEKIKQINDLVGSTIYVGQKLLIPIKPKETINYTVKSGDTLTSIAKQFSTTVDEIKTMNLLNSDVIKIGQILTLRLSE